MKIKMEMAHELRIYVNKNMQYKTMKVYRGDVFEVEKIEKYTGDYTHNQSTKLYTVTFMNGNFMWISDSLFTVVDYLTKQLTT